MGTVPSLPTRKLQDQQDTGKLEQDTGDTPPRGLQLENPLMARRVTEEPRGTKHPVKEDTNFRSDDVVWVVTMTHLYNSFHP